MAAASSYKLRIDGMDCAACALKIENALERLPGVTNINVSYTAGTLALQLDEDRTSPRTISTPAASNMGAASPGSTSARTRAPLPASCIMMFRPRWPLAPVTSTTRSKANTSLSCSLASIIAL